MYGSTTHIGTICQHLAQFISLRYNLSVHSVGNVIKPENLHPCPS